MDHETASSRPAVPDDAEAIAAIYNQGIDDRVATFETEHRTPEGVAERLRRWSSTHPAMVVERAGTVRGFAWTSSYRPRRCYDGVAEVSIYVDRQARGTGVGGLALRALIEEADRRGFWKLVSRIFPENHASRRLCAAAGFREVGIYRRHGRLDGRWMDCVIVERLIGEALAD